MKFHITGSLMASNKNKPLELIKPKDSLNDEFKFSNEN